MRDRPDDPSHPERTKSVNTPTYEGELRLEDALLSFLLGVGEVRGLHGLPQLGVLVAHRVVPHRQLGALHRVQRVVQTHVLPQAASKLTVTMTRVLEAANH